MGEQTMLEKRRGKRRKKKERKETESSTRIRYYAISDAEADLEMLTSPSSPLFPAVDAADHRNLAARLYYAEDGLVMIRWRTSFGRRTGRREEVKDTNNTRQKE
jgi:hypothetical protein